MRTNDYNSDARYNSLCEKKKEEFLQFYNSEAQKNTNLNEKYLYTLKVI